MAFTYDPQVEHLLRRAGFGARPDELQTFRGESFTAAVDRLINYERIPDDVDDKIADQRLIVQASVRTDGFRPNTNINDARQRWLFRMVMTNRPLQEKMTLFWHNHFATGYTKVANTAGTGALATRFMAAKASEDPAGVRGQLEMLRDNALGNFRDIVLNIARDLAMLYWLDGYLNTRNRPQENFARELMELFTLGVGEVGKPNYVEADVYAAARVFTGWNVAVVALEADGSRRTAYRYTPQNHDTTEKTFTFPIYSNGSKTIPARPAADGEQDGIDLINALVAHPAAGPFLATKLYRFFVSEVGDVNQDFVKRVARVYYASGYEMKAVMREVLLSPEFWDRDNYFTRYSWPVEFVVRSLKDVGYIGFDLSTALTPLSTMGQILFEPPDVAGWDLGDRWFSTGATLGRMNFGATLTRNQADNLLKAARPYAKTPDTLLTFVLESLRTDSLDRSVLDALNGYLASTGPWTGSDTQVRAKAAGLFHLVTGTPEYQFV
jgi:uncharacterized protein (DUF1800 family)